MKKIIINILILFMNFCIYSLPLGLDNNPMEQLISYLGNPVPEGFILSTPTTYSYWEPNVDGVSFSKEAGVSNNIVTRIQYIWSSTLYEDIEHIRENTINLFSQYNFDENIQEGIGFEFWFYNDFTFRITDIVQEGRRYYFSIMLSN